MHAIKIDKVVLQTVFILINAKQNVNEKNPPIRGIIFPKYRPMHSAVLGLGLDTILGISRDQVQFW